MDQVVLDVLLVGRGVPWVRFEGRQDTGRHSSINERIMLDYVHWDDFRAQPGAQLGSRRAPGLGGAEDFAYQGRG